MDILNITALKVKTRIGAHAWEQQILQQLLIDIQIQNDFTGCNDLLANTLDYDALCAEVTAFVESNHFLLIETVADVVAKLIKEKFAVSELSVTVSKPYAIKNAGNISVTVNR